jgi:hypothetical protein
MTTREALAPLVRSAALAAYAVAAVLGSVAVTAWLAVPVPWRALWLGGVVAVSAAVAAGAPWFWLSDARAWAQSSRSWRLIGAHLAGFALTAGYGLSVAWYVLCREGWTP